MPRLIALWALFSLLAGRALCDAPATRQTLLPTRSAPIVLLTSMQAAPSSPAAPSAPAGPNSAAPTLPETPTRGGLPQARRAEPAVYTLADTVRAALESSRDLQIAARNVAIDRKRADEVRDQGRPTVGTSAQATRYDQATQIAIGPPGTPPVETLPSHSEVLAVQVGQRLDLTGQIRAATNQARLQILADEFTVTEIRNARVLQAETLFFNLLRSQHQVQVTLAAQAAALAQQQIAQKLYGAQIGQKIDLLRANTQVATAQQGVQRSRNALDIARGNFNNLVGRPLAAPAAVADVAGVTVGESAPSPPESAPFTAAGDGVEAIDLDKSIQEAQAARPEVLADEVLVRVADLGIKLARAGQEPTFALNASGNYYPTPSFQFPRQRTAAVTATVTLPLYDGGLTRDRVEEARLRTENARTTLESRRADVALEVRTVYANLTTAARQIEAANAALAQAVATRDLALVRYQGQVGLSLEVTDAQAALVQAENAQVNAVYDYLTARAQFQNALGTPKTQ